MALSSNNNLEEFSICRRLEGFTIVLEMTGDLDEAAMTVLDQELASACALARPPDLVLADMAGVSSASRSAAMVVKGTHERCLQQGTPLLILSASPSVRVTLTAVGLAHAFRTDPSWWLRADAAARHRTGGEQTSATPAPGSVRDELDVELLEMEILEQPAEDVERLAWGDQPPFHRDVLWVTDHVAVGECPCARDRV